MHDLIPLFADNSHPVINEHMGNALRCPQCGAAYNSLVPMTESISNSPRYVITCGECKYLGPFGKGLADAVKRWNKSIGFIAALLRKWKKKRAKGKPEWCIKPAKKVWGRT
jgi:hypothetical protein